MTVDQLIAWLETVRDNHGGDTGVLHENAHDSDEGYPGGEKYSEPNLALELFDPTKGQVWPVLPTAKHHVIIN